MSGKVVLNVLLKWRWFYKLVASGTCDHSHNLVWHGRGQGQCPVRGPLVRPAKRRWSKKIGTGLINRKLM